MTILLSIDNNFLAQETAIELGIAEVRNLSGDMSMLGAVENKPCTLRVTVLCSKSINERKIVVLFDWASGEIMPRSATKRAGFEVFIRSRERKAAVPTAVVRIATDTR